MTLEIWKNRFKCGLDYDFGVFNKAFRCGIVVWKIVNTFLLLSCSIDLTVFEDRSQSQIDLLIMTFTFDNAL